MLPVTANDRISELSYAYLHAVASAVGASCQAATRLADGKGIDATLNLWPENPPGLQEVDLKIQLKATTQPMRFNDGKISFFLPGVKQYDDLRSENVGTQRILVVLFMPPEHNSWLSISEDHLLLRKCAYWAALRGAPPTTNATGATVYIPKINIFDNSALEKIAHDLSSQQFLSYES